MVCGARRGAEASGLAFASMAGSIDMSESLCRVPIPGRSIPETT
jgi:hypothetical protein